MSDFVSGKLLGRLASGFESDKGKLIHALTRKISKRPPCPYNDFGRKEIHNDDYYIEVALCGAKPGRKSVGWDYSETVVTCEKCLKKINKEPKMQQPTTRKEEIAHIKSMNDKLEKTEKKTLFTLRGECGFRFDVYQTLTGSWAWKNPQGEGFTNKNLLYILDYLIEAKRVHITRLEIFKTVYASELKEHVEKHPDDYTWSIANFSVILDRMTSAIEKGTFDKNSPSFKNTCKILNLKHTYKAIKTFIGSN